LSPKTTADDTEEPIELEVEKTEEKKVDVEKSDNRLEEDEPEEEERDPPVFAGLSLNLFITIPNFSHRNDNRMYRSISSCFLYLGRLGLFHVFLLFLYLVEYYR
jgi:hypothetical protein